MIGEPQLTKQYIDDCKPIYYGEILLTNQYKEFKKENIVQ